MKQKKCIMNKYSIIGRSYFMIALAVTERIQYWLVAGKGGVTSLSWLMSFDTLLRKFCRILCDMWRSLAA